MENFDSMGREVMEKLEQCGAVERIPVEGEDDQMQITELGQYMYIGLGILMPSRAMRGMGPSTEN